MILLKNWFSGISRIKLCFLNKTSYQGNKEISLIKPSDSRNCKLIDTLKSRQTTTQWPKTHLCKRSKPNSTLQSTRGLFFWIFLKIHKFTSLTTTTQWSHLKGSYNEIETPNMSLSLESIKEWKTMMNGSWAKMTLHVHRTTNMEWIKNTLCKIAWIRSWCPN
jgi:hypothetical protein